MKTQSNNYLGEISLATWHQLFIMMDLGGCLSSSRMVKVIMGYCVFLEYS